MQVTFHIANGVLVQSDAPLDCSFSLRFSLYIPLLYRVHSAKCNRFQNRRSLLTTLTPQPACACGSAELQAEEIQFGNQSPGTKRTRTMDTAVMEGAAAFSTFLMTHFSSSTFEKVDKDGDVVAGGCKQCESSLAHATTFLRKLRLLRLFQFHSPITLSTVAPH